MKTKVLRIFALLLAAFMVLSIAGCKKENNSSLSDEVEIEYVYEDGDDVTEDGNNPDSAKNSSGSKSGSKTKDGKTTSKTVNDGVNPEDYRGTTVVFATWRDPALYEDGPVVKAFQKKYGITIKTDIIAEEEYTNTVIGRIAAGSSPDVFFSTYTFPYCLSALQPIDAAKLNLKESIWDKSMIELSTINGKTYLVNTVGNIWNDQDMVYFNKKLMQQNNITTPAEYYKAGKWTFAAMKKCMQDVANLGSKYVGGAINVEGLINSTGASFMRFKNGQFSNGSDTMLTNVVRWVAEGVKGGYIKGLAVTDTLAFKNGNIGLVTSHAFGLKANGHWRDMNPDDIGFVPLPDWDENTKTVPSTFVRGWGICTGAKNPVAAGVFLRYYLDVNNYNSSKAFLNSEAESFFYKLTSTQGSKKNYYYLYGKGTEGVTGTSRSTYLSIASSDPNQVAVSLSSVQNTLNSDVNKLNSFLKSKVK